MPVPGLRSNWESLSSCQLSSAGPHKPDPHNQNPWKHASAKTRGGEKRDKIKIRGVGKDKGGTEKEKDTKWGRSPCVKDKR